MSVLKHPQKGILAWFIRNHIAANLLMLVLMVGGLVTALNMTVEIFPEVDLRAITINVPYPGSTPDEVEEGINRRVEESIQGIEGIKKIISSAGEGNGLIVAQLEDDANDREVMDDIKSAVDQIQDFPPQDAYDEQIVDLPAKEFVINIAIYGDVSERTLREFAYRIRDDLASKDGISIVEVLGARKYEIGINVSEGSLRKFNLNFAEVAEAVRQFSVNLPGGTIRSNDGEFLLRTDQQAYVESDFKEIPLRTNTDGTVLRLKDVAVIEDGFKTGDQVNLFNGQPAVFVDVIKVGSQQVLDIEERVKQYVRELPLPPGINVATWSNKAQDLRGRVDLLVRNGMLGLILVFVVLMLFLNLKLAFWTTMGIPISFLGAFILINLGGGTINMISLFAFIVVLGIVVDDAIIIGESIYSKREQGLEPLTAALNGVKEVMSPVTVGILTTIIAFAPLMFTTGILGEFLSVIPLVVISVLIMSLIEAFLILPAHLSDVKINGSDGTIPFVQKKFRSLLQGLINKIYVPTLERALKMPYVVVALALSFMIITVGALNNGIVKTAFFPSIDGNEIAAKLRMPNGTSANETEKVIQHIISMAEKLRSEYDGKFTTDKGSIIQNISAHVGSTPFATRDDWGNSDNAGRSHVGEVRIELLAGEHRPFETSEIQARWLELIGDIPGGNLRFFSDLIGAGDDIEIELYHDDFNQLLYAVEQFKEVLNQYDGVVEVDDSFELGKPEFQLELNDAGLASGLTLTNLARQVRQAYYGEEAQRVQRGRDDIEVLVRYSESERRNVTSINDLRIRLNNGIEVPLRTVATVKEERSYSSIDRANQRRVVTVSANVNDDIANANEINAELFDVVLPKLKLDIPGLNFDIEGEQKEQKESQESLGRGLFVAAIGIFAILAILLKSYTQPIIIMSVIPIGFIGAVIGHVVLGFPVSFFSFFGIVALSGVVINDSLILMDMINRLREQGKDVIEAILASARRRFRPIMFTTLTTCAGLGPIIIEKSVQAQFLIPMAISLAAGVLFATMITLVLVPCLYLIRHQIFSLKYKDIYVKP